MSDLAKGGSVFPSQDPLQTILQPNYEVPSIQPKHDFLQAAMGMEQQAQRVRNKAASDIHKNSEEYQRITNEPTPAHPKLTLSDMPALPDKEQATPPDRAIGGVMGAIAALASFSSRRPLTAALKAAAGAMKGAHQGDKERQDYNFKRYQLAVEEWKGKTQNEAAEYNAVMSDIRLSAEEKNARLNALIVKNQDTVAAAQMQAGGYENVAKILEQRSMMEERFAEQQMMFGLRYGQGKPLTTAQIRTNEQISQAKQFITPFLNTAQGQKALADANSRMSNGSADDNDKNLIKTFELSKQVPFGYADATSTSATQQPAPDSTTVHDLPPERRGDPDGTTYDGGKWIKRGNQAFPNNGQQMQPDKAAAAPPAPSNQIVPQPPNHVSAFGNPNQTMNVPDMSRLFQTDTSKFDKQEYEQ